LFEVGPRDGLQNESATLSVDQKVGMIHRLVSAGVSDIEIGSFVHPKWVPQMAETDKVAERIRRREDVRYWALVPNEKGLERALDVGVDHIATFVSASETHNQHNLNRSVDESLAQLRRVYDTASTEGCTLRAYVSTAFGCPYEGDVPCERVLDISQQLVEQGADLLSIGDTIGAASPLQVRKASRRALDHFDAQTVAMHFHDTRGLALTNAFVAYEQGIRQFDSAVGGTGGCPYAPGASGNVATEDVLNMFDDMDVDSGVEMQSILETSAWLDDETPIEMRADMYEYWRKSDKDEDAPCVA
jgi:hydroxymethylglutaryl-CoA lyase